MDYDGAKYLFSLTLTNPIPWLLNSDVGYIEISSPEESNAFSYFCDKVYDPTCEHSYCMKVECVLNCSTLASAAWIYADYYESD